MPKESNYKSKLGFFAIAALVIAVAAIYYVGKKKNRWGPVLHLSTSFSTVTGLREGSNVRLGGIDVGTVEDIELVTDSTVEVDMIIQKKVQRFIRKDAKAAIGSDGLMGDKFIAIAAGSPTSPLVADGDSLASKQPIETDAIMASLKASADNAAIITSNLADISERITHGKGSLGRLLHDSTLSNNISATMKNLRSGSKKLDENMEAAQHNFLLRGFFKKKKKQQEKAQEEARKQAETDSVQRQQQKK